MSTATLPTYANELTAWLQQAFPAASPFALAAVALTTQRANEGHVCVLLSSEANRRWQGLNLPDATHWRADLLASGFVAEAGGYAPLILDGDRLYLARLWSDETRLAATLNHRAGPSRFSPAQVKAALAPLFGSAQQGDGQYVAAATALLNQIAIIAGGPGTGKTTTVAKVLAALISLAPDSRICLAAPTGKAAARMMEALAGAKHKLGLDLITQASLPTSATTLHRLLGYRPDSAEPRHDMNNPLALDVLVVDEASMIDLALFSRLLQALPTHAQLVLLGDRDQLASVEAGGVFSELLGLAGKTAAGGLRLTQAGVAKIDSAQQTAALADGIATLHHSHRFAGASGIGALAGLANAGDIAGVMQLLAEPPADLQWQPHAHKIWLPKLLDALAPWLARYQHAVASGDPQAAMAVFNQLRLLCALRDGPTGVERINLLIETRLLKQDSRRNPWYIGRPVMVRSNDPAVGLANGDIGITLASEAGLRVYFATAQGWRILAPARIPSHDTAFAMTVHQSQGSEFEAVWLLMPDDDAGVLNRSLIYTAVTRARQSVTLWGSGTTLAAAIGRETQRASGLLGRLQSGTG